ncbi:MAG: hypothetical protein JWN78_16 [Bacteroidota bacterium]|nr:hypothetical protein [Bacteroidota bacterium]
MKKLLLALTMMAGTFGVFAQDGTTPAPAPDPNAPTMTFESDAIDYGTIKQDAEGTRIFSFTNTGKTPLVISEAHGSCGCTVPTYPKEPIMPGQKSEIKVHYDTHRVGPFSKSVTVNSNAKNSPVVLRISGTVEAPAVAPTVAEPTSIIPSPAPAPAVITTAPAAKTATVAKTSSTKTSATSAKSTTAKGAKTTAAKTTPAPKVVSGKTTTKKTVTKKAGTTTTTTKTNSKTTTETPPSK